VLRRFLALIAVLALAFLVWHFRRGGAPVAGVTKNAPSPQFTVTDLNGQAIQSAQLHGKVVLLDFWATWCAPCEAEIPQLGTWQEKYGAQGLQVIGLSMDDTEPPVKAYVQRRKISYPVAMADEKTIAAFGGVLGLPANIVIDRDGKVIAKHIGVSDLAALQREVEQALRK
jgi:thiol-disulfide isomerase/thioredoxin